MTLNMGPQHPSTHGVLRIVLELEGETILKAAPDIGFLHTGIEKECEQKTWQQVVTLTDRVDYLANLSNNLVYALAVEKLLQIEIPPRAQWMRVMMTELSRLNSHLVWLGTHALDIGAMSMFFYCFREREDILRIFEMFSGQRMMTSYIRIGGLALEPPRGWQNAVGKFIRAFPSKVDEYEDLLDSNPIWTRRTKGVGFISLEDMLDLGVTGPMIRGAGRAAGTSASPSRIRATTNSISRCRRRPKTTCTRGIACAWRKCGRARASSRRRWKGCRKAPGRPTRRTWFCRIAKR